MSTKILISFLLLILNFSFNHNSVTLFLAGDSTMAIKKEDRRPETGWGEKLSMFFNDNVTIRNFAKNGRSTKSFIDEGRWDSLLNSAKKGDYVFIQFGHNDEKTESPDRYSSIDQYKQNLLKFVEETRNKNCIPVLLTPIVRRRFDENGKFYNTHGKYPDAVREVAKEYNVVLIDMQRLSEELLIKLGKKKSKEIYLILDKEECNNYPNGLEDNTHFSDYGAKEMASIVVKLLKETNLSLKEYLIN